jgi:cytochrome c oxidase subunit III
MSNSPEFRVSKTPARGRSGFFSLAAAAIPPPLKTSPGLWPARRDIYRAKLVFYLFLVSLAVFFAAGLATYLIIRGAATRPIGIEYRPFDLPRIFVGSTLLLVVVSGALQYAVYFIRRENQPRFLVSLITAWVAASAFLVVQAFGMNDLLQTHFTREDGSTKVFGMTFIMAFLHALHVVGGMGFMGFVIFQGARHRYDHERNYAVEHLAAYWHFLDVVWLILLAAFLWAV